MKNSEISSSKQQKKKTGLYKNLLTGVYLISLLFSL